MHDQLLNQEIARLRYAEVLREATRRHAVVEEERVETSARRRGLVGRVRGLAEHARVNAPALRAGGR